MHHLLEDDEPLPARIESSGKRNDVLAAGLPRERMIYIARRQVVAAEFFRVQLMVAKKTEARGFR
ncbi:hypothetical protein D3C73_1424220 [compost metagenome]